MHESCPICTNHVYKITKTLTFENVYLSRETFSLSATHLQNTATACNTCNKLRCNKMQKATFQDNYLARATPALSPPPCLSLASLFQSHRTQAPDDNRTKKIKSSRFLCLSVSLSVPLSLTLSLSLCFFHCSLSLSRFLFLALVFVPDALYAGSR